jgi:hypothetical protein
MGSIANQTMKGPRIFETCRLPVLSSLQSSQNAHVLTPPRCPSDARIRPSTLLRCSKECNMKSQGRGLRFPLSCIHTDPGCLIAVYSYHPANARSPNHSRFSYGGTDSTSGNGLVASTEIYLLGVVGSGTARWQQ